MVIQSWFPEGRRTPRLNPWGLLARPFELLRTGPQLMLTGFRAGPLFQIRRIEVFKWGASLALNYPALLLYHAHSLNNPVGLIFLVRMTFKLGSVHSLWYLYLPEALLCDVQWVRASWSCSKTSGLLSLCSCESALLSQQVTHPPDSMPCCCCCCRQVTSVGSDFVQPHRQQPTRLPRPWDSPGKNTGVGCHFLLQCMQEKSESEVAQSCPTLCDPMDCSLPGSSAHGIFQARVLEWGAIAFSDSMP